MSRRSRYESPIKKHSTFALNITSMTDMFTILLVFLLQTYSTADVEILPVPGLRLPASNATSNPVAGIKVSISKDSIRIDDRVIAAVTNLTVDAKDIDSKDKNFIPHLFQELDQLAKKADQGPAKEGRILLQADEDLPYKTLRKVMYTSSMAGFPQLKLITVVGD